MRLADEFRNIVMTSTVARSPISLIIDSLWLPITYYLKAMAKAIATTLLLLVVGSCIEFKMAVKNDELSCFS